MIDGQETQTQETSVAQEFAAARGVAPQQEAQKATEPKEAEKPVKTDVVESDKPSPQEVAKAEEKPRESRSDRNWGKLTRKNHDLRRDNEKLQKRIAELEKLAANAPDVSGLSDRDAAVKLAKHEVAIDRERDGIKAEHDRILSERDAHYAQLVEEQIPAERRESFVQEYAKRAEHIEKYEPELAQIFLESSVGPAIMDAAFRELFASADRYNEWQALSTFRKTQILAQIEADLLGGGQKATEQKPAAQTPTKSAAPSPVAPDAKPSGSGSPTARSEFEFYRRKAVS